MSSARNEVSRDEPPYETKGNVTPVSGNRRTFPPMMRMLCAPMYAVRPAARMRRKLSGARMAVRTPRATRKPISASKPRVPTNPVSSAIATKTKSEMATGTRPGLPMPGPRPEVPPLATAMRDCTIWNEWPDGSSQGFNQASMRKRTTSKRKYPAMPATASPTRLMSRIRFFPEAMNRMMA